MPPRLFTDNCRNVVCCATCKDHETASLCGIGEPHPAARYTSQPSKDLYGFKTAEWTRTYQTCNDSSRLAPPRLFTANCRHLVCCATRKDHEAAGFRGIGEPSPAAILLPAWPTSERTLRGALLWSSTVLRDNAHFHTHRLQSMEPAENVWLLRSLHAAYPSCECI